MGGIQRIDFFLKKNYSQNWNIFPTWLIEIEPVFPTWLIEIEPFFSTWLWLIWLKELNLFLSMSQRIEFFHDSKNWTFFRMTQRFCWKRLKESNLFFEYDPKNRTSFYWKYVLRIVFQYDSQNWTYFSALLKEWNIWVWLKELNFLWYDSNNWTLKNSKNWFSQLQELNFWKTWLEFFRYDFFFRKNSKNWTLFLILRKALNLFLGDDSKNWTLLTRLKDLRIFLHDSKTSTFWTWLNELSLFSTWLKELNLFLEFDSMDWTLCTKGLKELDTKRLFDSNNQTFLFMTWWIGPFFFSCWLRELNFFSKISLKNYWPFLTWLTELNSVLENDSPNWTFFWRISLIEIEPFFSTWVKENDSIFSMTRRIFTKIFDSKNNDPFFGNIDPKNWLLWTKIWL